MVYKIKKYKKNIINWKIIWKIGQKLAANDNTEYFMQLEGDIHGLDLLGKDHLKKIKVMHHLINK